MIEKHATLFNRIDRVKVIEFEAMLTSFHGSAGDVLYRDGETEPSLFLIDSGHVEVHHSSLGSEGMPELRMLRGPGDYFGEMSLLDRRRRHTTVTATESVRGHRLPETAFNSFIAREPRFLINLARDVMLRTSEHDSELIRELIRTKQSAENYIRRLKAVTATSRVLNSTLKLDHLLDLILKEACRHTGADTGTIFLVERDSGDLLSRVIEGDSARTIRVSAGSGIAGTSALHGEILNIPDAYADPRFNPDTDKQTGYKTETLLTVPMRNQDREIVGVIQLLNRAGGPFEREDELIVEALGTHASIAIDKARTHEQLLRNESLAAIGNLASSIIHDFKNPLSIIRGYAELLGRDLDNEKKQQQLDIIVGQIDRVVGMTSEVLDYSRGGSDLSLVQVEADALLRGWIETLAPDYEAQGIKLRFESSLTGRKLRIDPQRFARVFFNLAGNARDALLADGGTITVRLSPEGEEHWQLEVADDGVGIAEERLATIFDPFASFGKEHGTGLGLAIVKRIVEQHGGSIEVESREGHGSHFRLRLPNEAGSNG